MKLERREIIDILTAHVISRVRTSVPWRPGARELLDELHTAGVRCALVTMSEGPLAREIVGSLPKPYFDFLVTGDTVTHGKPHPEAYLKAVELLQQQDPGLTLHDCVALEDSGPGVAAAVASGVVTVAIPHIVPLPARSPPRNLGHPRGTHRRRPRRARGPAARIPGGNIRAGRRRRARSLALD